MERENLAILLGGQHKLDLSYTYGETDGEGQPLYSTALMASGPVTFKRKPNAGDDSVTVLVNSGASGHYFDVLIILSLKHRLLSYVLLTTPRKILTAGGASLDGMVEGIQHLARIAILIVSGIGRNLFSVKLATKKGVVFIFDFDNPRLELSGITVALRAEGYDFYT